MAIHSAFSDITRTLTLVGVGVLLAVTSVPALAQSPMLPQKLTPRPQTTSGVPHVQLGIAAVPELSRSLLEQVAQLPGVQLGPTRVSMPGATGFQLMDGIELARPVSGNRAVAAVVAGGESARCAIRRPR